MALTANPPPSTFTKAKLIFLEPGSGGAEKEVWSIEFPYNPSTFSMTKGAKWQQNSTKDGLISAEYHGPVPSSITVKMFLDETTADNGDISLTVKKILDKVNPDPKSVSKQKPSAPYVRFFWGAAIEFKGYISQAAIEYTLFRENGNPVRGTVTLTLNEFAQAEKAQNPTSGGEPGSRAHRVVAGDTLASIAYDEYGSAADWRKIANANSSISDPLRLHPGTSLVIPPA
jgi:LysM repeat protein